MDQLRNIRLVVRRDDDKNRKNDCYVTLRADVVPREGAPEQGMTEIDYFFHRDAFEEFASGRVFRLRDLWRGCDGYGDDVVLFARYDALHEGRSDRGVAGVPFYRATIPAFVRKLWLRLCERVWDAPAFVGADRYERPNVTIEIPAERIERWLRLYGEGKGLVDLDASDETRRYIEQCSASAEFAAKYEQVLDIARHTTRGFHERARVRMNHETWGGEFSYGFGWCAYTPPRLTRTAPGPRRPLLVMNGGLLLHGGREQFAVTLGGGAGWSIHT